MIYGPWGDFPRAPTVAQCVEPSTPPWSSPTSPVVKNEAAVAGLAPSKRNYYLFHKRPVPGVDIVGTFHATDAQVIEPVSRFEDCACSRYDRGDSFGLLGSSGGKQDLLLYLAAFFCC